MSDITIATVDCSPDAQDTLAGIHTADDTEPRNKTLACGCHTPTDPGGDLMVKAINRIFDQVDSQRQADANRVHVASFDVA